MTGYARTELKGNWGKASWEIRTVNQRYLEINVRMSEEFRELDFFVRQYIRNNIDRGKIECSLRFEANQKKEAKIILNKKLINGILRATQWIKLDMRTCYINFIDLLKWPGVIEIEKENLDGIKTDIITLLKSTVKKLILVRKNEGMFLKKIIESRLDLIKIEINKIKKILPEILNLYKEKLFLKCKELQITIDKIRLEQEMLLLIQKIDINEELDRIHIHILETKSVINKIKYKPVGRRLDFIMQELNRETNTIASKSINSYITTATIEIKVLIEQMREQIQNIE
ncbi:YicC/YloC family endoribonuclease [Buchnera aphidicola (Formosaphis micheliae)]|uniref:YicC/YloC family endoribonuclease n=1 Tax=Buchnera aphidicola TaxID=9 RepID=UPI0031B807AF